MKVKELHKWLGDLIERGYENCSVMLTSEDEVNEVSNIIKGTTRIYLE